MTNNFENLQKAMAASYPPWQKALLAKTEAKWKAGNSDQDAKRYEAAAKAEQDARIRFFTAAVNYAHALNEDTTGGNND